MAQTFQSAGFSYQIAPQQQWVVEAPTVDFNPKDTMDGAVSYLSNDEQLYIAQGQYKHYQHVRLKVNSRQGIEQISSFSLHFAPEYQQLTIHHIWLWRQGDKLDLTSKADIRLAQRELETDQNIYNGVISAMVLLSDVQVGDVLEYAYMVDGVNPIYGQKRFASFPVSWSLPVQQARIRVLTEPDKVLYSQLEGKKVPLVTKQQKGLTEHIWQRSDIPAVEYEDRYPSWYEPYANLEVSEFSNWLDVVNWALPLYGQDTEVGALLTKKEHEWKQSSKSKQEYALQVVRFVQNEIRYFGLEVGLNTHQPFAADVVAERKYGDCKDKTNLMVILLRRAGIEAYPALVSTEIRQGLDQHLASPGVFDHVITLMKLDGRDYWIDGTRNFQFGGLEQSGQQYFQRALVIRKDEPKLTVIPEPTEKTSHYGMKESFSTHNWNDPVHLTVEMSYQGRSANQMRLAIDEMGLAEYEKNLKHYYQRLYQHTEQHQKISLTDDKEQNRIEISVRYLIPQFWDLAQQPLELALFGESVAEYAQLPEVTRRNMPLALEPGVESVHQVSYLLPMVLPSSVTSQDVSLEDEYFAYQRKVTQDGKAVNVTHTYSSKSDHVPEDSIEKHLGLLKKMKEALYLQIKVPNPVAKPMPEQKLREKFRSLLNKKTAS
jgi:transglutaminase-like putative cysteine protease